MVITETGIYVMANGEKACVEKITEQKGFCVYGAYGDAMSAPSCCEGKDHTLWTRDGKHCLESQFDLVRKAN